MSNSQLSLTDLATSPIGVFDSGIGGLTVAQCIETLLPNEQLIYLADNKFAPYGEKSSAFIINRVNEIADYFISCNVKAIVIACNTATVIAIDQLRARINIPVIGVEPAIKPAALLSQKQKVAILATQATANNHRFLSLVKEHSINTDVFIQACPGLVEQIELGALHSDKTRTLLKKYILPLKAKGIDKLVLGCTHYPMLNDEIIKLVGNDIELIDTGLPVAKQLFNILQQLKIVNTQTNKTADNAWFSTFPFSDAVISTFPKDWQLAP